MDKSWFDLPDIKRPYAKRVWIPLWIGDTQSSGKYGDVGHYEIYEGAHSLLVPASNRDLGEDYSWSSSSDSGPWVYDGVYKPSDIYSHDADRDIGTRLVLRQSVADQDQPVYHLHPDIIIALGLLQEGDAWVRPEEHYIDVVRIRRTTDGRLIAIEMRAEFLGDYLCARGASLRIASYRSRSAIVGELNDIDFQNDDTLQEVGDGKLEQRAWAIDSSGSPYGAGWAVFKASRNDIDPDDDVPVMGPETDGNVDTETRRHVRGGSKAWRVISAYWRDEWFEPAAQSPRVRRDDVPSQVTFVTEANGTRMNADALDSEDIGRWLWFKPDVAASLLSRRGAKLEWYTRETGGLSTPSDPSVHFGINESGLLTVYAYDIARLPEWERRFWAGFNVTPEGRVSKELLSAQVQVEVADTQAPEPFLDIVLQQVNGSWFNRFGTHIFRPHDQREAILSHTHRFRGLDQPGLLALAKDVARLTADTIDIKAAQAVAPPPSGEKRGSLKSLEFALATICGADLARTTMAPLFGIYELRLADAHLPRSDFLSALGKLRISEGEPPFSAAFSLLHETVTALHRILFILTDRYPGAHRDK